MKKLLPVFMLITMILLLNACGGNSTMSDDAPTMESTQSDAPMPEPEPTPEPTPKEPEPEPEPDPTRILTVSAVAFSDIASLEEIAFSDENGAPVSMSSDWDEWFENAAVSDVTMTGSMRMEINSSGGYDYSLVDGSMLRFVFVVEGEEYPIGVCEGSQLAVKESTNGYTLLAEESAKLSPPPVEESEASDTDTDGSADNGPIDEWFENVNWNGKAVEFTARKEAVVTGISVFVGGQEYQGDIIINSSGDMGLQSGAVGWPGSKLSLLQNPVIIFEGTTANCEVEAEDANPEQICIYLESGETLIKNL